MHIHEMSACHMYGYVYIFDLTMDIIGGVRPGTGDSILQPSLGSGATHANPTRNHDTQPPSHPHCNQYIR